MSREEKHQLLVAYWRVDVKATLDPQIKKYLEELKVTVKDRAASTTVDAFPRELEEAHQRLSEAAEHRAVVRKGKEKLEDLKRGRAPENSDEILDAGKPGLEMFRKFGQVYAAAPEHCRKFSLLADPFDAATKLYDQQRDIQFAQLEGHAQALLGAKSAVEASASKSSSSLSGLYGHWSGKAADRSRVFSDRFRVEVGHLTDAMRGSAELIRSTSTKVAQACRSKAEFALGLQCDRLPDRTVPEGLLIMQMANGRWDADVRRAAALLGGEVAKQAESDHCAVNDETRRLVEAAAVKWAHNFCQAFRKQFEDFKQMCDETRTTVDKLWKVLTDHLNQVNDNPFKELISGTPPGGGGDKPPIGGGGGGGAIGGGGGGGGGRIPPIAAPPPITPPNLPPVTPPIETPGGGTETSGLPGTPVPGGNQPRESVTFEDAGRKISVTSPTRDGHVTITVEGPDGKPKSYEVDFGPTGPEVKPMPQPGGIPVQPGNVSPGGVQPGPVVPQENPVTKADENGKATIRDGDRTILAERVPGDAGHIRVTVPGADGKPATYDLDFTQGQVELASGSGPVEEVAERPQGPQPGEAGLGSVPSEGQRAPAAPPMGSGMMMPPAAQSGGGADHERSGNNWRTEGYVVEEDNEALSRVARVLGGLDDEESGR
ncbi:hypothetical protein [Allokutzneria albata]|uniref:hypothetical protein n=1 Tax=Allokutzneria albata TaxID=211114 RepID=UPI0004C42B48|nr:hypothetical protein [Allokutzneria albata]